ncbi:MAG: tetratricopeptide repeat protein [Acidobacteriota bacterium]|nr:tetratricopeptide repeat protein [Acidobacteriota bacterium]
MVLEPGRLIGAYEIIEPLGRGGMGEVYRARDTRLGRLVAIKFVSSHLQGNPAATARLDREARLASSLNHPGIVTVFDVGRLEDRPYVVMELIEGRSLAVQLGDGRMRLREVIEIAAQVADALAAAHEAGIVHRDLKPQNIMMTPEGRAKIVDFGLSKIAYTSADADDLTAHGDTITGDHAVLGTAGYMAPEQVMGHAADARADQFALGTILYEMLTSRRAFRRDTTVQTLSSILEDEPPPIADARPDAPPALVAVVARCLAKRPEGRYASTRDLAHDLRDALEQIMLDTRSHSHGRRAVIRRWGWPLAASVAVAGAAVVAAISWQRSSAPIPAAVAVFRQTVVLPFANVTRDPADQVFADGLVETLTSSLTGIERFQRSLRVVPASEVRVARIDSAKEARQAFGATLAITGSIQRLASSMRLTLNLVDTVQLVQLGSRTIDFTIGQEAMTQDSVVGAVMALLSIELEPDAQKALTAGGTTAPGAYAFFVQGRGYLQRFDRGVDDIDRAIESLSRAVAADPRYALAQTALGEAYWRKYEAGRSSVWIDKAVEHCEKALAIDNRLPPVHVTLAMIARGRGRYEEAVAVAQRAIELDPVSSDGYRELGRAHEALNRQAEAEATYRKAIEARPDDWLAYNTLGAFLLTRGRWSEAESAFKRVIELTPDNTRAYNNLGVTYFRMGKPDDAAAMWEQSISIRPTYSAASNLGSYYFGRVRYGDAARAFERAVVLSPNDHRVWRNLGAALYWAPGERPEARAAFEKAVQLAENDRKINPRQPSLLAALADSYSMLGRRAEALEAAAGVERLSSRDPQDLFTVAGAYEQVGERALALHWLKNALAAGYSREAVAQSPSLAELRKDARYTRLINPATP